MISCKLVGCHENDQTSWLVENFLSQKRWVQIEFSKKTRLFDFLREICFSGDIVGYPGLTHMKTWVVDFPI